MIKLNATGPEPVQSTPDTQPTLLELEAIVEKGLSDTRRLYKLYRLAVH
jgi:hypothetical protein